MKNSIKLAILSILVPIGCAHDNNEDLKIWEVEISTTKNGLKLMPSPEWNGDSVLFWNTAEAGNFIYFETPDGISDSCEYLVCELYHNAGNSLRVGYNFYDNDSASNSIEWQSGDNLSDFRIKPRLGVKIGAIPYLKTNIVFPLSHLDAQEIFLERFPRQMKGTLSGYRISKKDVKAFSISIDPFLKPGFQPELQIKSLYFSSQPPKPLEKPETPVVDEFGQWAAKDFKGKVTDENDLKEQLIKLEEIADNASFPENWSKYGGWKEKRFEPTGFFYVTKEGEKWWTVDPDGYAFVSVGVDCIRPNSSGRVEGQKDIFKWLPDTESEFKECYNSSREQKMYDFFKSNLIRVYGEKWQEKWQKITVGLLKEYGVNTIGNWSDMDFIKKAQMPYVYPMSRFPSTNTLLYRDFPDVFSAEYAEEAKEYAQQLEELKDDPYMIGYFLRNEPHWGFGKNNIAFEMFAEATPSESKKEFVKWVEEKYKDISNFNELWSMELSSFDELNEKTFLKYPSNVAEEDLWSFSKILVRKYVDVPCDEVEKIDKNHMNLGMRYAWVSSELLYEAGERFDVFSINGYRVPYPPETAEVNEKSNKPVMIGEFHFGSIDRGLPSTGITGVANQQERGKAYRNYVEHGLSRNELIGVHYFQWLDQPIFGRFDGENYNIGVLTITHTPYEELVEAMKKTNLSIYEIITGVIPIYNEKVNVIPPIYF